MIPLFTKYDETMKKGGPLLNVEWRFNRGGYLYLSGRNCTFAHRLAGRGVAALGTEQEFILRAQVALDAEPRFSWLTLELLNFHEARIFYFWLKVWPKKNLKIVFNVGWRMTLESQKFIRNKVAVMERRNAQTMKDVKLNGGTNAPIINIR